jgi:hypothetical protein
VERRTRRNKLLAGKGMGVVAIRFVRTVTPRLELVFGNACPATIVMMISTLFDIGAVF